MPTEKQINKLLKERYTLTTEKNWNDISKRVSEIHPPILKYIQKRQFIPSSPTLMNGNTKGERIGTLSSCFTMGIEDSLTEIMDSMKEAAEVTRMGGGVGYDYSGLRGSNETVSSTTKNSGGPLSFIGINNAVLDGVMQGGARRGAGMAQLDIYHPDILKFINAKRDTGEYNRLNFSVRIPNRFYETLETNPNEIFKTINVIDKSKNELKDDDENVMTYKMLWDKIIESAWVSAEPGIVNSDIMKDQNTCSNVSDRVLNNPCSEFYHLEYASCNLGSVDLAKFVKNNKFQWSKFTALVKEATRFLDKIIDINQYPIAQIDKVTKSVRPIGLGFMGLAYALFEMEIAYNSQEALDFAEKLMKTMTFESMKISVELAKEKGPYEVFNEDSYLNAVKRFDIYEEFNPVLEGIKKYGIRHSCNTVIAPTGSISFIANTSGGIEPVFALAYTRKIEKVNKQFEEVYITDPIFEEFIDKNYSDKKDEILKSVVANNGSCQKSKILSKKHKEIFVTAGDLTPMEHIEMLAVVNNLTSLSVSKTINLPNDIPKEKVGEVYKKAHEKGIIGVTVYRDGSRDGILTTSNDKEEVEKTDRAAPKRPLEIDCEVNIATVNKKQYYVVIGIIDQEPYEIFTGENYTNDGDIFIPKKIKEGKLKKKKRGVYTLISNDGTEYAVGGNHTNYEAESLTRQISLNLRHKIPLNFIVEQLQKGNYLTALHKSISRTLKKYIKNHTNSSEECPNCESKMVYEDGCISCKFCGFSKCG